MRVRDPTNIYEGEFLPGADRLSRLIAVVTHAPFLSVVMWNRYVRLKHISAQLVGDAVYVFIATGLILWLFQRPSQYRALRIQRVPWCAVGPDRCRGASRRKCSAPSGRPCERSPDQGRKGFEDADASSQVWLASRSLEILFCSATNPSDERSIGPEEAFCGTA